MVGIPAGSGDGCILARVRHSMAGISIRWRESVFACEFHANPSGSGGTLLMLRDDELIHQEAAPSVAAAADRARELSRAFEVPRVKHA
jgi:hypothetical protein